MIAGMTYFRVKWRRLPLAYRRFIRDRLAPGGELVAVDCTLRRPTTTIDDRYVFQFGALGDATPEEYHRGGPRVADLLARYHSPVRRRSPMGTDLAAYPRDFAARVRSHRELSKVRTCHPMPLPPRTADTEAALLGSGITWQPIG